jgi:hypothetical protein
VKKHRVGIFHNEHTTQRRPSKGLSEERKVLYLFPLRKEVSLCGKTPKTYSKSISNNGLEGRLVGGSLSIGCRLVLVRVGIVGSLGGTGVNLANHGHPQFQTQLPSGAFQMIHPQ